MDRSIFHGAAIGVVLAAVPAMASAQVRPPTTVQLPTFRFFTVSTTVEVPDSGGAELGGSGGAASGRVERGIRGLGFRPFGDVATGSTRGAGNVSINAKIHDFDAIDRQLLGDDFGRAADNSPDALAIKRLPIMLRSVAATTRGPSALSTDAAGGQSIAEIRRQHAEQDSVKQQEAQRLFDQASELQAAGKPGVAKVYYQMAARRATGSLKERALVALRDLSAPAQSASAASGGR